MTFVTAGLAIAGICAIAIPIIIHLLFRQRRKPIEWAAMRFLLEAFRKHRKRLRLEQWLLLAVRCLILLLLGLALARPLLEDSVLPGSGGLRAVYLIVDDGLASSVTDDEDQTALDRHIAAAAEIVKGLGAGDAVGVITASRPAKPLLVPPSSDHGAVLKLLETLKPSESPTDLSGAFALTRAAVDNQAGGARESVVYLLSEFRGGSVALDSPPATDVLEQAGVTLLTSPAASEGTPNVQVVSIEPGRSLAVAGANDGSGQIAVKLNRTGGAMNAQVTRVRLVGDNLPAIAPKTVEWQPGQTDAQVEFMLNLSAAGAAGGDGETGDGEIGLTAVIDDDALSADNQRFSVIELRKKLRVLLVDRRSFGADQTIDQLPAGKWIRRALEPLEHAAPGAGGAGPIEVVEVEPAALDLADLRTADAAIVPRPDLLSDAGWNLLRQFVERGGLVVITPPGEINVHPWIEHLASDMHLPWTVALETEDHPEGLALAEEQPPSEMLRMISSDLADLVRPVMIERVLPIDRSSISSGGAQALLSFADGSPMMIAGNPAPGATTAPDEHASDAASTPGLVVLLAVAPELSWTTLPAKPLMLPLFHELVRQGLGLIRAAQRYGVGEQPVLASSGAAADVVGSEGQRISVERGGRLQTPLTRSGLFNIVDQSQQKVGRMAVNIDSRAAHTDAQSQAAVSTWLNVAGRWETFDPDQPAAALGSGSRTSPLAWLLLAAVFILLVAEAVLARWFSHAVTGGSGTFGEGLRPTIDESASKLRAAPVMVGVTEGAAP